MANGPAPSRDAPPPRRCVRPSAKASTQAAYREHGGIRYDLPMRNRWRTVLPRRIRVSGLLVMMTLVLAACGGGGSGGGGGPPPVAPASLHYAVSVASYETQAAIVPNTPSSAGGAVDSYTIDPPLPAGLQCGATTGVISGTPVILAAARSYTVTATNAAGSTDTTITLSVVPGSESLTAMDPAAMTDADIRHFLGRTWFGGTKADFDACKARSVPVFVDDMTTFTTDASLESAADALLVHDADPIGLAGKFPSFFDLAKRSVYLLLHNRNPFQEVLGLFWHDHFATASVGLDGSSYYWMKAHMDLWRVRGNGDLRTLLVEMARDWVMLLWLNGLESTQHLPNENFAREFWELFTLGVDNGYSQADITTGARAWTGYRRRYDVPTGSGLSVVEFDAARHDPTPKSLFGQTIAGQSGHDDFADVVDITLAQRPVAEFVCKKLFEHFCYPSPSDAVVRELARTLRESGYDLKVIVRRMLKSEAFFSARSRAGQVKSPIEYAIGLIRSTGLEVPLETLTYLLYATGHVPTYPPDVGGWPTNLGWLSAQAMLDRANIALDVIQERPYQANLGIDLTELLPAGTPDSGQVVDALATLLNVTLSSADRAVATGYLDVQPLAGGTTAPDPFDVTTDVDDRVRGLIYILAQHPTYQVR